MRVLHAAPGPRLLPQLGSADTPGADAWTLSDNPSADPVAPSFRLTVDVHAGLELRQSNDLATRARNTDLSCSKLGNRGDRIDGASTLRAQEKMQRIRVFPDVTASYKKPGLEKKTPRPLLSGADLAQARTKAETLEGRAHHHAVLALQLVHLEPCPGVCASLQSTC